MECKIKVPGSCGEIAQGFLNGEPFLITCPVEIFTTVTISDEFEGIIGLDWKAKKALNLTLNYLRCNELKFGIKLESKLPRGKGMASSSADIAAVIKAAALALNVNVTAKEIGELAAAVEPTDGVFYDGINLMNPLTGRVIKQFPPLPEYKIAVFDFGGTIDTIEFERRSSFQLTELPKTLNFNLMMKSALANQEILLKPGLEAIIDYAELLGALGLNVAHSGTVIGIWFDEGISARDLILKSDLIAKEFSNIKLIALTKLISGGVK